MKPQTRHIDQDHLVDFTEGRLPAAQQRSVEEHLAGCTQCRTRAAKLSHLIAVMRSDDSQAAPVHVLNRAVRLFQVHRGQVAPTSLRQRLVASLRFDSARQTLALGFRAGQIQGRELLYEAGDKEVQVRIEPAAGGWALSGQVLGPCTGGGVVAESAADRVATDLNEICEFSLPPLPEGVYSLILRLDDDVEVEVPELELPG